MFGKIEIWPVHLGSLSALHMVLRSVAIPFLLEVHALEQSHEFTNLQEITDTVYSRTPLNGHPSTANANNITESPNCPSIHFNT